MIGGLKVLAVIPARGGSKGIARKNLRVVGGEPLIYWSIAAAHASVYIDRTILSSEDPEIIEVAKSKGCDVPFIRPTELAQDTSEGVAPVLHALELVLGYDLVVLLQPTSPLRLAADIDSCLEKLIERGGSSCVSISEAECHPYLAFHKAIDDRLRHFVPDRDISNLRRQDFPPAWRLNGAVYAARVSHLEMNRSFISRETVGYVMPSERSLDIDTLEDLALADQQLSTICVD